MTLLVDPPMLFAAGYALRRGLRQERAARRAGLAFSGVVLGASVATYRDLELMRPVWTTLKGRTGRDLILNSWVLRFDSDRSSTARTAIVGALFASYPLWVLAGIRAAASRDGGAR